MSAAIDDDALGELATDLAVEAGRLALVRRRALGAGRRVAHDTKSSAVDPVTDVDREVERLVVDRLRADRPDDAIVGEEGADDTGTSGIEWHVDPIDGTVNFVYDLPFWCTSIAAVRDGHPVAGAVYAPVVDEVFSAVAGAGARLNGSPIRVSDATDLATSLVATGFSYHLDAHRRVQAERIAGVLPHVRDIRRAGSAALDLVTVACGRLDGYFEEFVNSWDIAAGALVVTEAGGTVTSFDGSALDATEPRGVFACAPGIVHRLREVLDAADQR